ncbi:unnamed protein product [Caenorhabditis bovis]|uniref:Phosphatidic acid phosphatase type 2/haloperoxidase domain-containing protein n=1 Tax=Caenorhabditis bovis TaxID=2654633 RepID=A0A8S1EZY0_9PELO|nr:unnamed protein product [Caenorhabditis bovis]
MSTTSSSSRRHGARIMEPTMDPAVYNVNGSAVITNMLLLYGFAAVAFIVPTMTGVVRRGFFCDDESIRYEYRENTVSTAMLITYNLLLDFIVVATVEYYRIYTVEKSIRVSQYRWRRWHINVLFVRIATYYAYSHIGFVMNMALNMTTKHFVGRLRPHFLDVCKPANNVCADMHSHTYITDYVCTGTPELVLEARKSFYSGHSCISLYCAVWAALYLQARLATVIHNRVIVPLLQTTILSIGLIISCSRITDNMHHWSDVLVGVIVGIFFAVYTGVFWTDMFKNNSVEDETTPLIIREEPSTLTAPLMERTRAEETSRPNLTATVNA